jgi:hypothetical protein
MLQHQSHIDSHDIIILECDHIDSHGIRCGNPAHRYFQVGGFFASTADAIRRCPLHIPGHGAQMILDMREITEEEFHILAVLGS